MVKITVSRREYERRFQTVMEKMRSTRLDALYLTNPKRIQYFTGCSSIFFSRPFGLLLLLDGTTTLIVPKIEEPQILKILKTELYGIDEVISYWEYPGTPHPLDTIAEVFKKSRLSGKKVGIDGSALADVVGVADISIQEKLPNVKFVLAKKLVDDMRLIKSPEEIELIKEAAKWSNLAHAFLYEFIKPGISEIEISSKATHYATTVMLKTLGEEYKSYELNWYSAWARFKAGPRTAFGHGCLSNRKVKIGDNILTSAEGLVGGYANHLERTMIMGEPSDKQKKFFEIMLKAQTAAIETCKPRVKCCDAHKAAMKVIKDAGLNVEVVVHHRSGHGIGLDEVEPPFLVDGNEEVLQPGMVFTVEPGIYIDGLGGFRHCDTIIITEDGWEDADYYPRDIESLTIRAH
jgi:Xaa-Pro aminopeptidase